MLRIHGVALGFALAAVAAVAAAESPPETGRLIQRVACAADSDFSYALYLPSGYTPERTWPLLVCFDPAARGHVPVGLLTGTAERYGYIVVGSNDSRNGPWTDILKAQEALWKEVGARYAVDPKRSYAVGFSGGARAGLHLALDKKDSFAGVLSCGAFYDERKPVPKGIPLVFFLTCGTGDFNLFELTKAHKELAGRGDLGWLEVFEGDHEWPSSRILAEGVEFFEATAMKRGLIPERRDFLDAAAKRRLASAESLAGAGLKVSAYRKFLQTAALFSDLDAGKEAASRAAGLAGDPEVREFLELEEPFWELHRRLTTSRDTRALEATLNEIKALASGGGPGADAASQLLRLGAVQLGQLGEDAYRQGQYAQAVYCYRAASDLSPGDPLIAYNAACCLALLGRKADALAYLRRAVESGFTSREFIERDKDLMRLRKEPEFREILDSLGRQDR